MVRARPWWERVAPGYLTRVLAAIAAIAVVLVGAVPMAAASANPNADPILAVAVDGTPNTVDFPAPAFHLVDQAGRSVSLSDLRGRTVALTFLDPVCTSDCPLIAQEIPRRQLAARSRSDRVVFVAVVANPIYRSTAFTKAFDRQEGLKHMRNWLFLTGSLPALDHMWDDYGIVVDVAPAGAMIAHSELAYVIDAHGHTREVLSTEPGNGSAASSSFSVYLANFARTRHQRVSGGDRTTTAGRACGGRCLIAATAWSGVRAPHPGRRGLGVSRLSISLPLATTLATGDRRCRRYRHGRGSAIR